MRGGTTLCIFFSFCPYVVCVYMCMYVYVGDISKGFFGPCGIALQDRGRRYAPGKVNASIEGIWD